MIGLSLVAAASLAAQDDPRCASTLFNDLLACASEARQRADRELNEQWDRLPRDEASVEAQRAWLEWRDRECTARNAAREGREAPIWQQACLAELTRQRTQELLDHYRWAAEDRDAEATRPQEECVEGGKGEAGYRQCLYEAVVRSGERVATALARNRREAAEEDADWEEQRRRTQFARELDPTHRDALERSQAAWEDYVEAQCTLEGYTALGGTAESSYRMRCQERLTLQRLRDLRSPFRLESQRLEPVPEE